MKKTMLLIDELKYIKSKDFKLGEYIYMGMAELNGVLVCVSTGYKIDYCFKKMDEFRENIHSSKGFDIKFNLLRINKTRVGETTKCQDFDLNNTNLGILRKHLI
jgi:hypothetical protein